MAKKRRIPKKICAICGESCKKGQFDNESMHLSGEAIWGYDSKKDTERWKLDVDVCEACVDKHIVPLFKKKIRKDHYM